MITAATLFNNSGIIIVIIIKTAVYLPTHQKTYKQIEKNVFTCYHLRR